MIINSGSNPHSLKLDN